MPCFSLILCDDAVIDSTNNVTRFLSSCTARACRPNSPCDALSITRPLSAALAWSCYQIGRGVFGQAHLPMLHHRKRQGKGRRTVGDAAPVNGVKIGNPRRGESNSYIVGVKRRQFDLVWPLTGRESLNQVLSVQRGTVHRWVTQGAGLHSIVEPPGREVCSSGRGLGNLFHVPEAVCCAAMPARPDVFDGKIESHNSRSW